jgi:hypothetical protein
MVRIIKPRRGGISYAAIGLSPQLLQIHTKLTIIHRRDQQLREIYLQNIQISTSHQKQKGCLFMKQPSVTH